MIHYLFLAALLVAGCNGDRKPKVQDQLVTMTKGELIEIISCIAKSSNSDAQKAQDECDEKMPKQTIEDFRQCGKEVLGDGVNDFYGSLAADTGNIVKIYECVRKNVSQYTAEETKQMVEFENCARTVSSTICPVKLTQG